MPALKALSCQLIALLATLTLTRSCLLPPLDLVALACLQGVLAAFMSFWLGCAPWWIPVQLGFMPSVVLALHFELSPGLYLAGFVVLCLVFWNTLRSQVPLFLSNRSTVHRLAMWLPDASSLSVLDVGCGTGSFLAPLSRLRPDWRLVGIENAPLPFAMARWRFRRYGNAHISRADFWAAPLSAYDLVYAFLSPVPMRELWRKARREMRPNSWLISNSFEIPGLQANHVLRVGDTRNTHLYCYQIPGPSSLP